MNKILKGHISKETAYMVNDYPYGFRLRCKKRYWLEYSPKKGFRLCSQTTNPKKDIEVWNKEKKSTYQRFGGCMFLDENNHVKWNGVSQYNNYEEMKKFNEIYREGTPEIGLSEFDHWLEAKRIYTDKIKQGENYHLAGVKTTIEMNEDRNL